MALEESRTGHRNRKVEIRNRKEICLQRRKEENVIGKDKERQNRKKELEACAAYFKARPVYRRLFDGFRRKYEGLGHFGGSVTLGSLTREEKADLGGFLQKDYTEQKSVTVSAARMEKALASSRFAGLEWKEILETYYGEALTVQKERRQREEEERDRYFQRILESCSFVPGQSWLRNTLRESSKGSGLLRQRYREDPAGLSEELSLVLRAVERLPVFSGESRALLPVFAAAATGDPHYFDEGRTGERLLTSFLQDYFASASTNLLLSENAEGVKAREHFPPQSAEEVEDAEETRTDGMLSRTEYKNSLFYEAGLLRDDLSNDVLAYGIRAWRADGSLHPGIEGFYRTAEPLKLTLRTLGRLGRIRAGEGNAVENRVYVVENPAVFSLLVEKHPDWTVLCGNGQVRLAVLVLMDQLARSCRFYYMGDFDPEGLLIAQRLKRRYGAALELWNYRTDWYERYVSGVELGTPRLRKLDRIALPELAELVAAMKRLRKAAYQETMAEEYLD
ncbi:MAG: TIGR02679 family protein [Eubacteriales bacterium]|nr:TIGR02679 family protein [Eubacteriales bacterium]